jgi:hypothetical protein
MSPASSCAEMTNPADDTFPPIKVLRGRRARKEETGISGTTALFAN